MPRGGAINHENALIGKVSDRRRGGTIKHENPLCLCEASRAAAEDRAFVVIFRIMEGANG